MKKLTFVLMCLCIVLFGCPHNVDIADGEKTLQDKQYDTISSLAYIGGSVVYNPANPSSAQLYNGANIAIYHSKLKKTQESAEALIEGKTETATWTTKTVDTFSIDREKDIYGYLKIQSVSSEAIVFDYHRFQSPEKKVVKSHTLKKNNDLDLDNDGQLDVKYTPLLPIRENFEGAMCLEFISNQEAGYSTMYATVTDEALARNTRTLEEYKNSTFYGVNSNGSFIYISGADGTSFNTRAAISEFSTEGISHGDYVINSANGEIFAVVGEVPENDMDTDPSTSAKELSLKKSEDYIEVNDNIELQAFFTYIYRENQFADEENGPQALLRALPKELVGNDIDVNTCTAEEALKQLFSILTSGSIVEIIVEANGGTVSAEDQEYIEYVLFEYIEAIFPNDVFQKIEAAKDDPEKMQEIINANWNNLAVNDTAVKSAYLDLVAMNRLCIEQYYPESPRAAVLTPDISSVYPIMSLHIAEIPEHLNDDFNNTSSTPAPVASVRSSIPEEQLASEYKAYLAKKQQIDDEFSKFYSMSLSSITITELKDDSNPQIVDGEVPKPPQTADGEVPKPPHIPEKGKEDKPKQKEVPLDALHFELKIGITGSFESMTGYMKSSLAAAIYTSFDGNLREFNQPLPMYKKPFADKSTTFMIGPVPFTLRFEGTGSLGLEAQFSANVNYAVKFVGMYGGGADLSVSYGCERWYKPWTWYVNPRVSGRLINNTEYYVGPVTQDIGGGNSYGGHVIFKPAIQLTPSIAVGPEYAYAGVGIPVTVYFNGGIGLYNKASQLEDIWFMIKEEFIAAYNLYGRLGLGTTVSVTPKLGVKIPLIKKKLEYKFNAIKLLDAEVFVNNKHQFEARADVLVK